MGKKYTCDICNYSFMGQGALEEHNNAKHVLRKNHQCTKCEFKTAWKGELRKHVKVMHEEHDWQLHHCTDCGYKTKYKKHLNRHMKTHEKERKKHQCTHCAKEFLSLKGWQEHITVAHGNVTYKCDICDFETKWKINYDKHIKCHGNEEELKCPDCTFSTHWRESLNKHIKTVHILQNTKIRRCKPCKLEFKSYFDYNQHIKANHQGKCKNCDYQTMNSVLMRRHQERCNKNVKLFHCEHCEFKASSTFVLGFHRNKIHGRENKCSYCDFETDNHSHFKIHTERCKNSKESFFCQYCSKRFTSMISMTSHIQYQHHRCRFCKHFGVSELARKAHENGSHESELKGRWIVILKKLHF